MIYRSEAATSRESRLVLFLLPTVDVRSLLCEKEAPYLSAFHL